MALDWDNENNSPQIWSSNYPEAGHRQSPIDISPVDLTALISNRRLEWKYIPENILDISNTGHSWKVDVKGDGSELTGGPLHGKYVLEQIHAHWGETDDEGSEHSIDGQKFAGELHLVHRNATKYHSFTEASKHPDGLCVLGVFLKPGKKHPELEKLVSLIDKIEYKGQSTKILEPLNLNHLICHDSGYYTYQGSLTTPPFLECVIWIVFKEPMEVSREQLKSFRRLKSYCQKDNCPADEFQGFVKSNFRPTLPVGQREVKECRQ